MTEPKLNKDDFFKKACYFEASLILVAIFLGWISGINPFENLHFSEIAIAYGLIGTAPLFAMFLVLEHIHLNSVVRIRQLLLDTLGPGLHRYHWTDLLILAAVAGVSEEVVFRGVIQPWMELSWGGTTAALIGSNLIFGLAHALTPLYAVLAGLVGIYLGLSMDYVGDRNLIIPVVIHGLYDYLAFILLMRAYRLKANAKT
ncbi:MAG: CPBP family intramembrane metalloprotease [Methylococcaceae bacterium]|nr:CPBP family intramembrane metalloprotease [Methylococcaceae bacterium]